MGSSPAPHVKQSRLAIYTTDHSVPQSCWQPRAWHIPLIIAIALLLFFVPVTYNSDEDAASWVRGLHRRGGSVSDDVDDVGAHPAVVAAASDWPVSTQEELRTQEEPPQLLYSNGGFQQEQHSCPFDFSQPVPAGADGQPHTYAECLAQHGRSLDEGYDFRWLEKAAAAGPGTARQAHIVRHVRDMWLWSLRRGVGTPCRPMVVTYVCRDDGHVCGGLGDRVKGQNLAFWQAVLTHSFFVSQWERPVPVQEYLLPADDTLGFPDVRACLGAPGNASARSVAWRRLQVFSRAKMRDFDYVGEWRGADVVESRSNAALFPEFLQAASLAPALARYRLAGMPTRDLLHTGLALYLSRPSPYLEAEAAPYLRQLGEPRGALRVGIHVRLGGAKMEDPERQPIASAGCFGDEALAQCGDQAPRPCVAFLAADSAEALEAVTRRLEAGGVRVVAARGTITHNDKPHLAAALPADDRAALVAQAAKTYLDWYLLTRMEALVMSHSGFSFAAAWAGSPASARWMALAQARAGTCHFLDYGSRCRGARCAGVGYDFARVDDTDDLGMYGNFTAAAPAAEGAGEGEAVQSGGGGKRSAGGSGSNAGGSKVSSGGAGPKSNGASGQQQQGSDSGGKHSGGKRSQKVEGSQGDLRRRM